MTHDATTLLRSSGLRATKPRMALLSILSQAKRPLKAQEIINQLPKGMADTATVYRSVSTLVSKGVVRRIDLDATAKYYELERGDDHHHLVCTQCHKIEDVHTCEVDEIAKQVLTKSSFKTIDRHNLEFFGICESCSA